MPPSSALSKLDETARAEYWAALALRRSKGLGARSIRRLLGRFGSAFAAVHNVARWNEAGVPVSKGAALESDAWRREARPEWEDSRDLDGSILLWTDPRYPSRLRELPDAPALLYARGDLSLLDNACVAVVGLGLFAGQSAPHPHPGPRTVGLRGHRGIGPGPGHRLRGPQGGPAGTRPHHRRTRRRAGCRLSPRKPGFIPGCRRQRTVAQRIPPGTRPEGSHFPIRNRIISGLALGVVVVEAAPRSGSLITARLALDQNRAVYAVPPPGWPFTFPADTTDASDAKKAADAAADCDGCARLLTEGACPALNAADILTDLLPQLRHLLDHVPAEQAAPPPLEPPLHPHTAAAPAPCRPGETFPPTPPIRPKAGP